jgi:two-component system chemotaxis response regulator CheY
MNGDLKKVLVVDDSTTMRQMVMATLRTAREVRCVEAGNGLEAIERLALEKVDLLVLDLNMPDMHGLEVVKFVRKHAAFHAIPIIVLTTRSDDTSRETVLAAGASSYLNKPFNPAILMEHARRHLSLQ